MDWDDFKFFSAVARCGTVRAAARELGVNPSTVTRRIEQFESRVGAKLFARTPRGLVLTPGGAAAVGEIQDVERSLARIERSIREEDRALAGTIRIVVPEFLLLGGVLREFGSFVKAYPRITVEWLFESAVEALTTGDADLGVWATSRPPLDLVGRRIGSIAVSVYRAQAPEGASPAGHSLRWLEWLSSGDLGAACAAVRAVGWLDIPVCGRCNTLSQLVSLLRAGAGISALPCIVGDREPGLVRLPRAPLELIELWRLMVPEVRYTGRVRLLSDYLAAAIVAQAVALRGEAGLQTEPLPGSEQIPLSNP